MTSLYIICFVLLSAGIILLIGLTPESITDDIMRIFAPEQTLRDKVLIAKYYGPQKSLHPLYKPS